MPPHLSLNGRNRSRKWPRSRQRGHPTSAPVKACVESTIRKTITGTGAARDGDNQSFWNAVCRGFGSQIAPLVGQSLPRSLVTKYFAKGVLRCPGSGYVARFTAQRDRISLHTTLYFLVDGLRRGARTSGSSCLWRRCLSISALFRASTMDCSKYGYGRQHDNSLFHRASLTKTKEVASGFPAGIPTTNLRKRAAVDRGTAARSTE